MAEVEFEDEDLIEQQKEEERKAKSRKRIFVLFVVIDVILFLGIIGMIAYNTFHGFF